MWSRLQTALLMVPSGIRFNDCLFSEPTRLADWKVPKYAGLFVILATDANWVPKPYQPLYFGEFGNNTPETSLPVSYALPRSQGYALFISVLPMPFSTTAQRWALRNELLCGYNTTWQTREARTAGHGLTNQVGFVKPQTEEAAQILLLLTGVNKLFEPPPEQPRRRIGFV
jgi:hypothetical protein